MATIVAQNLPKTHAKLLFKTVFRLMQPTPANMALLEQYSTVSQDLGYGIVKPLPPNVRGAGDISHIAAIVSAGKTGSSGPFWF